jgi:DNA-binding NarL/FixJ family response regulator
LRRELKSTYQLGATLRIIIVDDHEFFRKGLVLVLNKLKFVEVVGEAVNGKMFLEMIETTPADIVLMDINMPLIDGAEATRLALSKFPKLKIVALSSNEDEETLEKMIDAGVKGFLLKNIDKDILTRALQVVAQDKPYFSDEFMPYFTQKYLGRNNTPDTSNQPSKREMEVLQQIALGYTNNEIADKLCISMRTVTNHRAALYQKTNTNNTAALLSYSIKIGWVKI